jgi:hypothetical protein
LTRYEWSKLWWMSGLMSGRLVQPCAECGTRLRMSSMALVSTFAAIGLLFTASLLFFYRESEDARQILLFVVLALLLVILVATLATRIEAVPSAKLEGAEPAKPDRIGKKRL